MQEQRHHYIVRNLGQTFQKSILATSAADACDIAFKHGAHPRSKLIATRINQAPKTYTIHELQNLFPIREGYRYTGSLRGAKSATTRGQVWQGTVLKIVNEAGLPVAIKDQRTGEWYAPANFE